MLVFWSKSLVSRSVRGTYHLQPMLNRKRLAPAEPAALPELPVLAVRDLVVFPGSHTTLHVAREGSLKALRKAQREGGQLLVLVQRDMTIEEPTAADLYDIGTVVEPLQAMGLPDGSCRVTVKGIGRAQVARLRRTSGMFVAAFHGVIGEAATGKKADALTREAIAVFTQLVELVPEIPSESLGALARAHTAGEVADWIAYFLNLRPQQKQEALAIANEFERLQTVYDWMIYEREVQRVRAEIRETVAGEIDRTQREFHLREQLRAIRKQLEEGLDLSEEAQKLRDRIRNAGISATLWPHLDAEVEALDRNPGHSSEAAAIRDYLDWVIALPWSATSKECVDLGRAKAVLDEAHYGMPELKERLLDYLAVRKLAPTAGGAILCFEGPPGVGKTSMGKAVADGLGRKFARIALGGIHDDAEIRGHRRTYIGARPGRIIQALRSVGVNNPVLLLDELDKMGHEGRNNPTAALLEVLDPAQNHQFSDHYIELPFDLSNVLFIVTANHVDAIPTALRDRLEVLSFPSYSDEERLAIANTHLWPRALRAHGLLPEDIVIRPEAIKALCTEYTLEPGVRDLDRQIAAICRKAARQTVEGHGQSRVDRRFLLEVLGDTIRKRNAQSGEPQIGVCFALMVGERGGRSVPVEAAWISGGDGERLRVTGNQGEVMRESAQAALTFARRYLAERHHAPTTESLHVHATEGAIPKDGPSAGLCMAMAIISAWLERPLRSDVATTGELSLHGNVLAVGGMREKLLAAKREGFTEVLVPEAVRRDVLALPKHVRTGLKIHYVSTAQAALEILLVNT